MPNLFPGNSASFPANVKGIADGEPLDGAHLDVTAQDAADRTAYLKVHSVDNQAQPSGIATLDANSRLVQTPKNWLVGEAAAESAATFATTTTGSFQTITGSTVTIPSCQPGDIFEVDALVNLASDATGGTPTSAVRIEVTDPNTTVSHDVFATLGEVITTSPASNNPIPRKMRGTIAGTGTLTVKLQGEPISLGTGYTAGTQFSPFSLHVRVWRP